MEVKGLEDPLVAVAAVEHLTGPSRGTVIWLGGPAFDVSLQPDGLLRVAEARLGAPTEGLVARLRRGPEGYRIEAIEGRPVWVNGVRVETRGLEHCDMIEFGETGPLSRFRLFVNQPVRSTVGDILNDALAYLRVSRQPVATRAVTAVRDVLRRLTRQTTLLFRVGVVLALGVLAALMYQQNRLNRLFEERIDTGVTRLDTFARALARARDEALTPQDLEALRGELGRQLSSEADRLRALEQRSQAVGRVIAESTSSVGFLQAAYGFRESSTGRLLRHLVGDDGLPLISPWGEPVLSLEGDGPVAERQVFGTGFAIGDHGVLVTNRHVALPWEDDAHVEALAGQDLEPVMIRFIVYFPGNSAPADVELLRASDAADLALVRRSDEADPRPGLRLAETPPAPGDEVVVMGYPTGLRSMLARSGAAFVEELQRANDTGFWSVAARLAEAGHIVPLASGGIVAQVTPAVIVYDAETTFGGSGGPVLDLSGAVVAVNSAILPEYGGSNLGVSAASVRVLLADAGLRSGAAAPASDALPPLQAHQDLPSSPPLVPG